MSTVVPKTVLEYCGESERDNCGYCGGGNSLKLGLWAHALTPSDYMNMLDRGWRRSGKYMYKPTNDKTCCPQYTIRLDITKFILSRSQKRTLRQMNEYLATGKKPRTTIKEDVATTENLCDKKAKTNEKPIEMTEPKEKTMQKKKDIRRERFERKCKEKNLDIEEIKRKRIEKEESRRRTIESFTNQQKDDWMHKLEVKIVSTDSDEFKERDNESFELYKKYQQTIHKDDECRLAGYRRFLCETPMDVEEIDSTGRIKFGSYHIRFILDDKLIAVSVIDVLPRCLSAKYMFYDPDYSFLSIGTYTALREIEETRKFCELNETLKYYYMGYYIHSCPKMRYKAKFRPSDLLCDKSMEWVDFETCNKILNESKAPNGYSIFRNDSEKPTNSNMNSLLLISNRTLYKWSQYVRENPTILDDEEFIRKLERLLDAVGPNLPQAVYFFNELNS